MTAVEKHQLCIVLLRLVRRTILDFPDASFQIVKRQVADLVLQAVEIHCRGAVAWM